MSDTGHQRSRRIVSDDMAARLAEIETAIRSCREFSRCAATITNQCRFGLLLLVMPGTTWHDGSALVTAMAQMNGSHEHEQYRSNKSAATDPVAIEVAHLVKLYKATRASTACRSGSRRPASLVCSAGNGAGKTTTIAMIMGLVLPSGRIAVLGHPMPTRAPGAGPDEFRSPLCRYADAADGAAEPHHLRPLYAVQH